jgi:hypothetical protein
MSALSIQVPYQIFADSDGTPLDNGYVWIGTTNLDPRTNPVNVYFDAALTQVAPNPLRTVNGYVYSAGSPAQLYIDGVNFSLRVEDKKSVLVYSFPSGSGISPNANGVVYNPAGTGAVATTVQSKLRERVSVFDFMTSAEILKVQSADASFNASTAIQSAINSLSLTGGVLYFPAGTYFIGATLSWTFSGLILQGAGMSSTFLKEHSTLGANAIIKLEGTPVAYIEDCGVDGMEIRNGDAQTTTFTLLTDGIDLRYTKNFTLQNTRITEIKGVNGFHIEQCIDTYITKNHFYRCTYSCCSAGIECDGIYVHDNVFDTVTALAPPNVYLFATGGNTLGEGTFGVRNLIVQGNKFLNNPRWEGIDSHGGENITIRDNYIENVKVGILVGLVNGYWSNPVTENVVIDNNIIVAGSSEKSNGIVVSGDNESGSYSVCKHVLISNNKLDGFGGEGGVTGAITVYLCDDVIIESNRIDNYYQYAVYLFNTLNNVVIRNNTAIDCLGGSSPTITAFLGNGSSGVMGVVVEQNSVMPTTSATAPKYFIRHSGIASTNFQITPNNKILTVGTGLLSNTASVPFDKSVVPVAPTNNFLMAKGDIVYNNLWMPGWVCTAVGSSAYGYGSTDTSTVIVNAAASAGSSVITVVPMSGAARWLQPGCNISIAGAGTAGAALLATVVRVISITTAPVGGSVEISTPIVTTITAGAVTYQGITLTAV